MDVFVEYLVKRQGSPADTMKKAGLVLGAALLTLLLLAAMPGGSCCAIFTRQYGGDWGLATRCVMLSTLCAMVTVPLWLLVTIL